MHKKCAQTVNSKVINLLKTCAAIYTVRMYLHNVLLYMCGKVGFIHCIALTSTQYFYTVLNAYFHLLIDSLYLFSTGPIIKNTNFIKYI